MADINVTCAKCGHGQKVSEFVAQGAVSCTECGETLEIPTVDFRSGLKVRAADGPDRPYLTSAAGPARKKRRRSEELVPEGGTLEDVYRTREKPKGMKAFASWVVFFVVAAFLVWMQMLVRDNPSMLTTYNWVRGIIGGLVYLLVIVVAFEDHLWQGLLALVIPPYCLYYALIRLDAYFLRNIFLAVVVAFVAELRFIPDHALITYTQHGLENTIHSIEGMIQRAGDAPTFN
jgi:hypothetical protein